MTLTSSQNTPSWSLIKRLTRSSRIVLKCRDECCDENRYGNRVESGFEFKCVFESRFEGRFEYCFECVFKCLHAERECCVRALGNQLSVVKCGCKRMRVQIADTSVARNKANTSADIPHTPLQDVPEIAHLLNRADVGGAETDKCQNGCE